MSKNIDYSYIKLTAKQGSGNLPEKQAASVSIFFKKSKVYVHLICLLPSEKANTAFEENAKVY